MTSITLSKSQKEQLLALQAEQELSLLVSLQDELERGQNVQLVYGRGRHYKVLAEAVVYIKKTIGYKDNLIYADVVPISKQGVAMMCEKLGLNQDQFIKQTAGKLNNYLVLSEIVLVGERV